MYRTDSYNKRFSEEIKNKEYAQEYIKSLLYDEDEPMRLEDILKLIIKKMGTTDFAAVVGEKTQTIDKFLKGERRPKRETLDKYLLPFGVKTRLDVAVVVHEDA